MRAIGHVEVEPVPHQRRHVLDALMQPYLHDFSEHAPLGTPHGEADEDGRFAHPPLDAYWGEPGWCPFLIRAEGRVAGFALVNRWSALDRPLDHAVAEFFTLRKYRRAGVGSRAARLLFDRLPGRWEVPVAAYNEAAMAFWRALAARMPVPVEECAGDGTRWRGPVLRFTTGGN